MQIAAAPTAISPAVKHEVSHYYPAFDWLRIAMASIVVMSHEGLLQWEHAGNFAVQVFFALSGWLIGGILLNTNPSQLPKFYFNRAIRIWVPYFTALLLLLAAGTLHDHITKKWVEISFYKATFVYNLFGTPQLHNFKSMMPLAGTGSHFWSVDAEEQFYLLAPLLLVLVTRLWGRNILTWVALASLAWLFKTYASIVFGVLAAVTAEKYGDFHLSRAARLVLLATLILCTIAFILNLDYDRVVPAFSIALVLLLASKGKRTRIGTFLGGISYELYLNHWIGAFIIAFTLKHMTGATPLIKLVLVNIAAFGVACALYTFLDKPLMRWRSTNFTELRGLTVTALAYSISGLGCVVGLWFMNQ